MEEQGESSSVHGYTIEVKNLHAGLFWPKTDSSTTSVPQTLHIQDLQAEDDQTEDKQPEDYQFEHHQREDFERPDVPFGGFQRDHCNFDHLPHDHMQPASTSSPGMQGDDVELLTESSQSDDLDFIDLQSASSSPSDLTPYDPDLRMDVLTNETLLLMAQAWQKAIEYVGETHTVVHPHFQRIMEELGRRGMIDENWTYVVDLVRVNMTWRRVTLGPWSPSRYHENSPQRATADCMDDLMVLDHLRSQDVFQSREYCVRRIVSLIQHTC